MEQARQGKAALISGIQTDAHTEEQRIVAEAIQLADEKRRYAEQKAQSLLEEARQKADEQARDMRRKILSDCQIAIKRRQLQLRDNLIRDIVTRVEKKLQAMCGHPDYRKILADWITEAAIGLQADSARINASQHERDMIDAAMLSQVTESIQRLTGKTVTLSVSDAPPLNEQGPVLTSQDGRTAFNNQVKTRLGQKQRQIYNLIYDTLFVESIDRDDEKQ